MRALIVLSLLVVACASTPDVIRHSSAPVQPKWIALTPRDETLLYFVGASSGSETLEDGKGKAAQAAFSQAAQYIGVGIEAFGSFTESNVASQNKNTSTVKSATTGIIQGAEISDVYYDQITRHVGAMDLNRFDVWVLARFPRAAAEAERARQEKDAQDRAAMALTLYQQATTARAGGKLTDALRTLKQAMLQLEPLQAKPVDLKQASFATTRELTVAVTQATADVASATRKTAVFASEKLLGAQADPIAAGRIGAGLAAKGFPTAPPVSGDASLAAVAQANGSGAALAVLVTAGVARTGTLMGTQAVCIAHVHAQVIDVATQALLVQADRDEKVVRKDEQQAAREALVNAGDAVAQILVKALLAREAKAE